MLGSSIPLMAQIKVNNLVIATARIIVHIIDTHVIIKFIISSLTHIFTQLYYSLIYHT